MTKVIISNILPGVKKNTPGEKHRFRNVRPSWCFKHFKEMPPPDSKKAKKMQKKCENNKKPFQYQEK